MDRREKSLGFLDIAGAFPAWIIGAGFATGQETVQFFARHGLWGGAGVLLFMAGLAAVGRAVMLWGFEHGEENHFIGFCGSGLGRIYTWLTPAAQVLILPVLLSGGGTVLAQEWGVDRRLGTAGLAVLLLVGQLRGFRRFSGMAAIAAPLVIFFALGIGAAAVLRSGEDLSAAGRVPGERGWAVSALLYLGMNAWGSSTYHKALGQRAKSRRAAAAGAVLGAVALSGAVALLYTALLCSGAGEQEAPILALARGLPPVVERAFLGVLLLGIFSSCSAMLWTISGEHWCRGLAILGFSLLTAAAPFQTLVGRLYPLLGWMGLPFVVCVLKSSIFYGDKMKKDPPGGKICRRVGLFKSDRRTARRMAEGYTSRGSTPLSRGAAEGVHRGQRGKSHPRPLRKSPPTPQ